MTQFPKFFVCVSVKPYVRQFLVNNYGYPIDFTKNAEVNKTFRNFLIKPDNSRDNAYPAQICTYTELVEVVISEHDFYKYGFELSRTDTVSFGKLFENKAKFFMRNMVGTYHAVGLPVFSCINKFQQRFNFDEDTWSFQTIKKDFYRNGTDDLIDFNDEIFFKLENIILRNLYKLGTVCEKTIIDHENNK